MSDLKIEDARIGDGLLVRLPIRHLSCNRGTTTTCHFNVELPDGSLYWLRDDRIVSIKQKINVGDKVRLLDHAIANRESTVIAIIDDFAWIRSPFYGNQFASVTSLVRVDEVAK